jgi:hypothetical protein
MARWSTKTRNNIAQDPLLSGGARETSKRLRPSMNRHLCVSSEDDGAAMCHGRVSSCQLRDHVQRVDSGEEVG